jgi:hypothetical protein
MNTDSTNRCKATKSQKKEKKNGGLTVEQTVLLVFLCFAVLLFLAFHLATRI